MKLARIQDAVTAIASGKMIIVVDDLDRENEGDLILAAEAATPENLAFMINHTSGVVCVALPPERLDQLEIPLMVAQNGDAMGTAFTVTVDYKHGTTTGISAADRATTIRALVNEDSVGSDFSRPGHIFPLRAVSEGVLRRRGHTEAAIDLTRLGGMRPGGVLCEITNCDGSMAKGAQLEAFAQEHGLLMVTIDDLAEYRRRIAHPAFANVAFLPATPRSERVRAERHDAACVG
jgi:3,4-dihydroxy-2-butanone 4-phosphate synthase